METTEPSLPGATGPGIERLVVCGQMEATRLLALRDWGHVLSIGGVGEPWPAGLRGHEGALLRLEFTDIECRWRWNPHQVLCSLDQVAEVLDFAPGLDGHVIVHCHAGISRSSAATYVMLCHRGVEPAEALRTMFRMAVAGPPHPAFGPYEFPSGVFPNRRIVWMADHLARAGRRWIEAYRDVYGGRFDPDPEFDDFEHYLAHHR